MSNLQFDSIDDIKRFKLNLQILKMQQLAFQTVTLNKLANDLVLDKIHQKMRDASFSEKIIENTIIVSIEVRSENNVRIRIRSEYFSETGFDVALAREEGTDKHEVVAGKGKVLPIPTNGGIIFRKSANPDGIPALFIIRNTIEEMTEQFQDEYNKALDDWRAKNLGVSNAS